jgi:hypothetical protein
MMTRHASNVFGSKLGVLESFQPHSYCVHRFSVDLRGLFDYRYGGFRSINVHLLIPSAKTARAEMTEGGVQISVSDNGPGLTDEVRSKLFEPFLSTKASGMGVGLSVCKTIITSHKGRIWAEQNSAGGTIFRVILPLAPERLSERNLIEARRTDPDQCGLF